MIVNEFESLEAVFEPPHNAASSLVGGVKLFLMGHWVNIVTKSFQQFIETINV